MVQTVKCTLQDFGMQMQVNRQNTIQNTHSLLLVCNNKDY